MPNLEKKVLLYHSNTIPSSKDCPDFFFSENKCKILVILTPESMSTGLKNNVCALELVYFFATGMKGFLSASVLRARMYCVLQVV